MERRLGALPLDFKSWLIMIYGNEVKVTGHSMFHGNRAIAIPYRLLTNAIESGHSPIMYKNRNFESALIKYKAISIDVMNKVEVGNAAIS
jgi:hypothetical protein